MPILRQVFEFDRSLHFSPLKQRKKQKKELSTSIGTTPALYRRRERLLEDVHTTHDHTPIAPNIFSCVSFEMEHVFDIGMLWYMRMRVRGWEKKRCQKKKKSPVGVLMCFSSCLMRKMTFSDGEGGVLEGMRRSRRTCSKEDAIGVA